MPKAANLNPYDQIWCLSRQADRSPNSLRRVTDVAGCQSDSFWRATPFKEEYKPTSQSRRNRDVNTYSATTESGWPGLPLTGGQNIKCGEDGSQYNQGHT